MKKITLIKRRTLTTMSLIALLTAAAFAQGTAPGQQQPPPTTKGAVLKGKAPVNKEVLKVKLPKPYETRLSNGLQVLVLEDHKLPTFSMQMVILSGGLADPAQQPGAAQYTATMLREGTKTRTSRQLSEQIDQLGASLLANASLTSLTSTVAAAGLIDNFDQIMALFADVILNPSFPADEFNKLKQRGLAQLRLQRAQPGFLAGEMFAKALYGAHPGGRYALNAEQINSFTPARLQQFHDAHYRPNNAIFAIVGAVKPAEIVAKLEQSFAAWKPGDVPKTELPKVAAAGAAKIYLIDRPGSVQTNLVLGTLGIERNDPDYFALEMMNQVLGGGASARLFLNLREDKSYTYGAYSSVSSYKYPGAIRASSEVRTEVTKGSLDEFMYELKRIRDEQTPAEEFARAQRTIIGGWALQLESPQSVLQNAITQKLYNLPLDYWDTYPQKIAAVTPADVQRAAQKYLDLGKLQIIAVGDAQKIADVLKAYGTVERYNTDGGMIGGSQSLATGNGKDLGRPPTNASAAAQLAGAWTVTANTPDGVITFKLDIKPRGTEISGTLDTPFGQFPVTSGALIGNDVKLNIKAEISGNPAAVEFNGKLDGETMKGQISSPAFSTVEFTAKREK